MFRKASKIFLLLSTVIIFFYSCNNANENASTSKEEKDPAVFKSKNSDDYLFHDSVSSVDTNMNNAKDRNEDPGNSNNNENDERDKMYDRFKKVSNMLAFHTRDTMAMDQTYIASLAMAKNISEKSMDDYLNKVGEQGGKVVVRDTTQEIALLMSAKLEDKASEQDPNFTITLVGSTTNIRRYDSAKNQMLWEWKVTPLKPGLHELVLTVSQVDKDGIPGYSDIKTYPVTIYSTGKKKSSQNSQSFFEKNWQWIISAILVPVFVAWFTTRRRNAMNNPPKK